MTQTLSTSNPSPIHTFFNNYRQAHTYSLPSWVPSQIRDSYPYFHVSLNDMMPFQWLKMQSVMKVLDESLAAWECKPLPPKAWICLRYAPTILSLVSLGNLSKYTIAKPAVFLRDHWSKIGLAIQTVAALSLFAAGRKSQAGGMLISISVRAVLMVDAVPAKVKSLITIVEKLTQTVYFGRDSILNYQKAPWQTAISMLSIANQIRGLVDLARGGFSLQATPPRDTVENDPLGRILGSVLPENNDNETFEEKMAKLREHHSQTQSDWEPIGMPRRLAFN